MCENMGHRPKQRILNSKVSSVQKAKEGLLHIHSLQENENQSASKMSSFIGHIWLRSKPLMTVYAGEDILYGDHCSFAGSNL